MTIATGSLTDAGEVLAAVAASTNVAPTGKFYSDQGAKIARFGDRLLVGAATDSLGAADRTKTTDWLSTYMATTAVGPYQVWGATTASLSRFGATGLLAASRTSDAAASAAMLGYTPSTIGLMFLAVDDDISSPRTTTAYGLYGEIHRAPGVKYQPSFGLEVEGICHGEPAVGLANPYTVNVGGGISIFQFGSGGGCDLAGLSPVMSAISFVANPSTMNTPIIFAANVVTGVTGSPTDNGYGAVMSMGRNHALEWHTPETVGTVIGGNVGLFIRSTVTIGANATRWEAQDSGFVLSNSQGQQIFAVETKPNVTSSLFIQPGQGGGASALYVAASSGGSPNLGLYPGPNGELQISSPVGNAGGGMPATAGGGFLHININGADFRIPLFTAAQAGT